MKRISMLIGIAVCFVQTIFSQTSFLNATQIHDTPLLLNPALTGSSENNSRIFLNTSFVNIENLRDYRQFIASADHTIYLNSGDKIGIGLLASFDETIPARTNEFESNQAEILGLVAYHKNLSPKSDHPDYLVGGIGIGMYRDEYEHPSFTSNQRITKESNVSGGLSYLLQTANQHKVSFGVSFRNASFDNEQTRTVSWYFHANGDWRVGERWRVLPAFLFHTTDSVFNFDDYINTKASLAYKWHRNKNHHLLLGGGAMIETYDSATHGYANVGYEISKFQFRVGWLNYDDESVWDFGGSYLF